jgi:DNA repair protein RadA/Sms
MARSRTVFLCNNCGSTHPKWMGKCPDCGTWDSLEEYKPPAADPHAAARSAEPHAARRLEAPEPLAIDAIDQADSPRIRSGIGEFDRILGGGIVPGSAVLVGGEPGIGKSTLLLQVANALAQRLGEGSGFRVRGSVGRRHEGGSDEATKRRSDEGGGRHEGAEARRHEEASDEATKRRSDEGDLSIENRKSKIENPPTLSTQHSAPSTILYVTSEESARQTALRATRLGAKSPNLLVLAETNVERILNQIHQRKPAVVVIDSIQMIYKPQLPAAPGSVTQLRDCCMDLVYLAKSSGIAVFFVGHVTKAGTLAGPKIIEHIVDTVVYFEGDRFHTHRIVRCVKNRFGSTHEVGLFEMTGGGLAEITDPGRLFMEQYGPGGPPTGSVITAAMQGSRVLLLEVQALTASSVIGAAKRKVSGASSDRVAMIIAVLEKRAELRLAADDVFVNIAGGVKVAEPAIDLAIALAISSAHLNRPLAAGTVAIGELGLGGEVRSVPQLEQRLREASRLGCGQAIVPRLGGAIPKLGGMALHEVRMLSQAMAQV